MLLSHDDQQNVNLVPIQSTASLANVPNEQSAFETFETGERANTSSL